MEEKFHINFYWIFGLFGADYPQVYNLFDKENKGEEDA